MMVVRDKSVCISQASEFYNKSATGSDDDKDERNDQMALQFCSQDELFETSPDKTIHGFSFFGKRDMMNKQSIKSDIGLRDSNGNLMNKSQKSKTTPKSGHTRDLSLT